MAYRACSALGIVSFVGVVGVFGTPCTALAAQAPDSTGMPSLDQLALEAGRASRRNPIRAVSHTLLCEPSHPLVDSASLAACASLDSVRAAAITAAFARGVEVPLVTTPDSDAASELPICPADPERTAGPRILLARVMAPMVGMRDGRWEGRLVVEVRCRSDGSGNGGGWRTMGKEYIYQWNGREWRLYQFAWLRA